MSDLAKQRELRRLIAGFCDGALDDSGVSQLEDWLRNDRDALRYYVAHAGLHASLAWMISVQHEPSAYSPGIDDPTVIRKPRRALGGLARGLQRARAFFAQPTHFSLGIAGLVVAVIVAVLALLTVPGFRSREMAAPDTVVPSPIVATLGRSQDAVWAPGQTRTQRGIHLRAGYQLELEAGLTEIDFSTGTRVVLEGPATFDVVSDRSGRLEVGRLVATVAGNAKGFIVNTPLAAIVDLGTEFGVSVESNGPVDVHVFQGSVEIRPEAQQNVTSAPRLKAGAGMRLLPGQQEPTLTEVGQRLFATSRQFLKQTKAEDDAVAYWKFEEAESFEGQRNWNALRSCVPPGHHLDWYSSIDGRYFSSEEVPPARMFAKGYSPGQHSLDAEQSLLPGNVLFVHGTMCEGFEHVPGVYTQFALPEFTVEGFFQSKSDARQDVVFYGDRFVIYLDKGQLFFEANGCRAVLGKQGEYADGRWHYFAASCQVQERGNTLLLRALAPTDRKFARASAVADTLDDSFQNVAVGGHLGGHMFQGLIDEVRFSRGVLGDDALLAVPASEEDPLPPINRDSRQEKNESFVE